MLLPSSSTKYWMRVLYKLVRCLNEKPREHVFPFTEAGVQRCFRKQLPRNIWGKSQENLLLASQHLVWDFRDRFRTPEHNTSKISTLVQGITKDDFNFFKIDFQSLKSTCIKKKLRKSFSLHKQPFRAVLKYQWAVTLKEYILHWSMVN